MAQKRENYEINRLDKQGNTSRRCRINTDPVCPRAAIGQSAAGQFLERSLVRLILAVHTAASKIVRYRKTKCHDISISSLGYDMNPNLETQRTVFWPTIPRVPNPQRPPFPGAYHQGCI